MYEKLYQQSMDELRFSPQQIDRIAENAANAVAHPSRRRTYPVRRVIVLAAALTLILIIGAGASGVLRSAGEVFASVFGGAPAQTEVIDKIGHPIGASDTCSGITISADAILGDPYNACILYTIARDDGTPVLPDGIPVTNLMLGGFGGTDFNFPRSSNISGGHGTAWVTAGDNGSIQYVDVRSFDQPWQNCTAAAEFHDLSYSDGEGNIVQLAKGSWKFRFEATYEDTSVTLGNGETFQQDDLTFTIDQVTVSPIAVSVSYRADQQVQWSNAPSGRQDPEDQRQVERFMENVSVILTKTDGTTLDLSNAGGSMSTRAGDGYTHCTKGGVLQEIVPMEDIASVTVGGIDYPIA